MILAIDPGKDKCGLALFNKAGKVVEQKIVKRQELHRAVIHYHDASKIIIGESANGRAVSEELKQLHSGQTIVLVSEKNSTWEARQLYWQAHPPRGWRRFIPATFLSLPVAIDDYAAVIIGRRYFASAQLRP